MLTISHHPQLKEVDTMASILTKPVSLVVQEEELGSYDVRLCSLSLSLSLSLSSLSPSLPLPPSPF